MTMKKILLLAVISIMMLTPAVAHAGFISMYLDVPSVGQTSLFDRISLATIDATSSYLKPLPLLGVGDTFTDVGDFAVGALTKDGGILNYTQSAGLSGAYEITGRWEDLKGYISGTTYAGGGGSPLFYEDVRYTSGNATFHTDTSLNAGFGAEAGSWDDDASSFTDGDQIMAASLMWGRGSLSIYADGTVDGDTRTYWKITDVPEDVWFNAAGDDLEGALEQYGWLLVKTDVSDINNTRTGYTIDSTNTGSVQVAVPEPASMILFSIGVMGLAGMGRKKKVA